jgi:GxxExxY protein
VCFEREKISHKIHKGSMKKMNENELSNIIIGAAIKVHKILGPGLLESVYERVLCYELRKLNLVVDAQKPIQIQYEEITFDEGFKADVIVEDKVIIEIKSIKSFDPIHHKQLLTYLRLSKKKLGLLLNFNVDIMKKGIKRVVNAL